MEAVSGFWQRTPVGQLVAEQFTAPEEQVPALHSEHWHVDAHKCLSLCLFIRVLTVLCCLAQVAKPFLNCSLQCAADSVS